MFALCEPKLEKLLSGLVLLNTPPTLWHEASAQMAVKRNLPALDQETTPFIDMPCQETFMQALIACSPYYFTDEYLQQGAEFLMQLPLPLSALNLFPKLGIRKALHRYLDPTNITNLNHWWE